jgi:hypothetical protein
MALFEAKVVKTAGDQHQIKLDEDGTAWWEPNMNVCDVVVHHCTATGPPCDGIWRMHFVEGFRDELFDRRCESAHLEFGRLRQDATR